MRIVFKEPDKPARTMFIPKDDLGILQKLVGGYIEVVTMDNNLLAIVNENGKLLGLKPSGYRYYCDDLVGNVILCGADGDEFTDVPEDIAEWVEILNRMDEEAEE